MELNILLEIINPMFNIFYNWPAKLFCLILAILLWTYVAIGESQVDNFPGKIPLSIKNTPSDLIAISDVDSVQIKISADRATWQKLSAQSFESFIDLGGLQKGTNEVRVNVKSNTSEVEIIEIVPEKILVRLELIAKKKIPVKVQTDGQAGEGLVPDDAKIELNEVEISGAQSVIDKILEATALIQLNGETEEINKTVELAAYDAQGEAIKYVEFNPKSVVVGLPIVKAGSAKTVGIKARIEGKPKNGYWLSEVTTTPLDLTIRGTNGVLRGINFVETKAIDVSGLSSDYSKNVELDLPSGITLADNNSQVKVEIKFSANKSEKEVSAAIDFENLASNLKIETLEPNLIKVMLSGSQDVLSALTSSSVKIKLNLSGYNLGNFAIDINKNMISVPEGVEVISFLPSAVRIGIGNK